MKKTIILLCIFLSVIFSVVYGEKGNVTVNKCEPIESNYTPFIGNKSGSDVFGYEYLSTQDGDAVTFNWIEISGTGIPITLGDDSYATIALSFPFLFYDDLYNSIDIQ